MRKRKKNRPGTGFG